MNFPVIFGKISDKFSSKMLLNKLGKHSFNAVKVFSKKIQHKGYRFIPHDF